jgi:hypothetical protein
VIPTRDRRNRRQTRTSRNPLARSRALLASAGTLVLLIALPCASAGAAESGASPASPAAAESAASPLPASDYTVRPVCASPAPGYAGCLALELVPSTETARARTHPLGITRSHPIAAAGSEAAEGAFGLRPQDLHSVYQLPTTSSSPQTIAIVDAYNDLNAAADLNHYSKEFGLSELAACTAGEMSDCFEQVNQNGETVHLPFPATTEARGAEEAVCKSKGVSKKAREAREAACKEVEAADGWATEISLDIEVSHAVCQNCKIVLVEADSASFFDLGTAEDTAAGLPATEISNSWGGAECSKGTRGTECGEDSEAFNHQGIVTTAAAGDDGYLDWDAEEGVEKGFADYPASSPHVVAVGGTRLSLGAEGEWAGETVWNGKGAGGGGCSISFPAPAWQTAESDWSSLGCGEGRAVADVSADADPYTGVAVYDSTPESPESPGEVGWTTIGGTSLASPLVASVFALAGGAHGVKYPAETLYENEHKLPGSLHDVTSGSNGECSAFNEHTGLSDCSELEEAATCSEKPAICLARIGYDGPSGVGTPDGIAAFKPSGEEGKQQTEKQREEEKLHEEKLHEEEQRKQDGDTGGSGPSGNGSSTGGSSTSASGHSEAGAGASQASGLGGNQASETAGSAAASSKTTIKLSALALTPNALLSLRSVKPKTRAVGFAFTLSADARVHATLAKLVRVSGRELWKLVPGGLSFAAIKGRNRRHLNNHNALSPGRYRLTLTPQSGAARSIVFQIG